MSFRKYGGVNFSAKHNQVNSNFNNTSQLSVTKGVGQEHSYINLNSDISGNIIVYGNFDISGNLIVEENLYVNKNVDISGNETVVGTIYAKGGITGSTASFQYLTGGAGSLQYLTGGTGSFEYLTGASGSFEYLTGGTGSFEYLTGSSGSLQYLTGGTGSFEYLTGASGSFQNLSVSGTATVGEWIIVKGGITGPTGYFDYLYLNSGTNYSTDADAVMPKSYIDSISGGISPIQSCACATTNNLINFTQNTTYQYFTSVPTTIDGYVLVNYDFVLVKNQTNQVENGVYQYVLSEDSLKRPIGDIAWPDGTNNSMYVGYNALGAFTFVQYGVINGKIGFAQTNYVTIDGTKQAIVGVDSLIFTIYFQFSFNVGRGLGVTSNGNDQIIEVDTSLNFINYLDSNSSSDGGSGTLNIGSNTDIGINIGNSTENYTIHLFNGITGGTGSFQYLTGSTGSFQYLISDTGSFQYLTGSSGSFEYLTGSTGSFQYLTGSTGSMQYLTGSSGSFEYLTGGTGSMQYLTGSSGSFEYLTGSTGSMQYLTGGTGSFQYLTSDTGSMQYLTGSSGSFEYLTGGTGSFQYLTTANDATIHSITVGLGGGSVSSNTAVGYNALLSNTTGNENTALGNQAGINNTTGQKCTFIGASTDCSGNWNNSTAIGYGAQITTNNQIVLGTSSETIYVPGVVSVGDINCSSLTCSGTGSFGSVTSTGTGSFGSVTSSGNITIPRNGILNLTNDGLSKIYDDSQLHIYTDDNIYFDIGTTTPLSITSSSVNINNAGYLQLYDGTDFTNMRQESAYFVIRNHYATSSQIAFQTTTSTGTLDNRFIIKSDTSAFYSAVQFTASISVDPDATINGLTVGKGGSSNYYNTAFGINALYANTTGSANVGLGYQALYTNSSGANNVAIGSDALRSNTTASNNVAIGYHTLYNTKPVTNEDGTITTPNDNTAVGTEALGYNTSGYNNTAVGRYATYSMTTGNQNTSVGMYSLYSNLYGVNNTSIGYDSLSHITSGNNNVAIGVSAGTSGKNDSGGYLMTNCFQCTFLGGDTFSTGNWSYSTAIGWGATISGDNQIVLGTSSETVYMNNRLYFANNNVDIGGPNKITLYTNYGFGIDNNTLKYLSGNYHRFYTGSSQTTNGTLTLEITPSCVTLPSGTTLYTGGINGNPGGSTIYVYAPLDMGSNSITITSNSTYKTAPLQLQNNSPTYSSSYFEMFNFYDDGNTYMDLHGTTSAGSTLYIRNPNNNYALLMQLSSSSVTVGTTLNINGANYLQLYDGTYYTNMRQENLYFVIRNHYTTSGQIAFQTTNSTGTLDNRFIIRSDTSTCYSALDVTGALSTSSSVSCSSVSCSGTVSATAYTATSDYRIKDDVKPLDDTFTVDKLNPVTYYHNTLKKQDVGFLAHEVQEEYPFMVTGEKDGEEFQTLNYNSLLGILVKEIKDLKKEIGIMKNRIHELENTSSN